MARELEHRQHRYPLFAPVRAGHCSATLTGAPLRTLAVLERALRVGIIEIPHLSPWWLGGVGGGGAQGTPWAENPRREYSEPLVAVPAGPEFLAPNSRCVTPCWTSRSLLPTGGSSRSSGHEFSKKAGLLLRGRVSGLPCREFTERADRDL